MGTAVGPYAVVSKMIILPRPLVIVSWFPVHRITRRILEDLEIGLLRIARTRQNFSVVVIGLTMIPIPFGRTSPVRVYVAL